MRKDFEKASKEIKEKEGKDKEKKIHQEKEVEEVEMIPLPDELKATIFKLVEMNFDLIAKRFGDHWKLDQKELKQLGSCYVALVEKYLPATVSRFSVEFNALFWTGIIISKRITSK